MTLYFARHGETEWNAQKKIQGKTDIPLNEKGLHQSKLLADELRDRRLGVARIYTSPYLRAAQTAQIIADELNAECIPIEDLREMDLGEWEGSNWNRIKETYGDAYHYWNTHRRFTNTPGGECYNDVLRRALNAFETILRQETEDTIVVSHSAVLMAVRCYLSCLPFEEMAKRFKTQNAEAVKLDSEELMRAIDRFSAGE